MLDRIKSVIDFYNLSPSAFADKIGVQRSALSHVLSGRNKPSLDFIVKVKKTFPDLSMDWLTLGVGNMLLKGSDFNDSMFDESNVSAESDVTDEPKKVSDTNILSDMFKSEVPAAYGNNSNSAGLDDASSEKSMSDAEKLKKNVISGTGKMVDKIVWFYSDGTFSVFYPENK